MGDNQLELEVQLRLELENDFDDAIFKKIEAAAQKASKNINRMFGSRTLYANMSTSVSSLVRHFKTLNTTARSFLKTLKEITNELAKQYKVSQGDLSAFNNVEEQSKKAKKTVESTSKDVSNSFKSVFDNMTKEFGGKLGKVGEQFNKVFNGATLVKSLGKVAAAVGVVVTAITVLWKAFNKVIDICVKLIQTGEKISKPFVSAFAKIESTILSAASKFNILNASLQGFNSILGSITNSVKGMLSKVSFTELISQSVELSSSLTEVKNVIDQVFGDNAKTIYDFTQSAIKNLGMTTLAAQQYAGKFGAAMRSTGQAAKDTVAMSKALTQLTSDIASFYDIEQDIAAEKIFSGVISGMVKPMRTLGVDMTNASLNAWMLAKGLNATYESLNATQKQAVRFEYVIEKLDYVHGDYARTLNTTANQLRLLKNQFKELGSVVGAIINAFFNPFIQILNRVVAAITNVAKSIASIMGIDWTLGTGSGVSTLGGIADDYDDLADSADELADAEDGVAKSTDKAAKAAKKALAPFHKLNVLQNKQAEDADKNTSKSKSAGSGVYDIPAGAIKSVETQSIDLKKALQNLYDAFMKYDWAKAAGELANKINAAIPGLRAAVRKYSGMIKDMFEKKIIPAINTFIDQLDTYNIGGLIGDLFKGLGDIVYAIISGLDFTRAGEKFGELIAGILSVEGLAETWGRNFGAALQSFFNFILGAISTIPWNQVGTSLYNFVKGAFDEITPAKWYLAIKNGLSGITTALNVFLVGLSRDQATITKIGQTIASIPAAIADYLGGSGWSTLVKNAFRVVKQIFAAINDAFMEVDPETGLNSYESLAKGITEFIQGAVDLIHSEDFQKVVVNILRALYDGINEGMKDMNVVEKGIALKLLGFDPVEWTAFGVALNGIEKDLYKVDGAVKTVSSDVELYKKYNKEAYDEAVKLGKTDAQISKLASEWVKSKSAAEQYDLALKGAIDNGDKLDVYVVNIDKLNKSLQASGKSIEQLGLSSSQFYASSKDGAEGLIKLTDTEAESVKKLSGNTDLANLGFTRLTNEHIAGLKQLDTDISNIGATYDTKITPSLGKAEQAVKDFSKSQVDGIAIATKFGFSEGEAIQEVAKKYGDSTGTMKNNMSEVEKAADKMTTSIDSGLSKAKQTTATGVSDVNTETKNLYGSDVQDTIKSNVQDNIVDPMVTTLDEGLVDADFKNKLLDNITDPELKSKVEKYLDDNLKAGIQTSFIDINDFLVENGGFLVDESGNLIGNDPETLGAATKSSIDNGIKPAIIEEQSELTSGDYNLLTKDDTLLGVSQDDLKTTTDAVLTGVETSINEFNPRAVALAQALLDAIELIFTPLPDWIKTDVLDLTEGKFDTFNSSISGKLDTFKTEKIEGLFSPVPEWFNTEIFGNITSYFDTFKSDLEGKLDDIKKKIEETFIKSVKDISSAWDEVQKVIESTASSMKSALDDAKTSADNLASSLREAASAYSDLNSARSNASTSSSSGVQGYASGGVFRPNNPQLALLGDHKSQTEYALTTGHLKQIADMMSDVIGSTGFEGNITIPIYVDGVLSAKKVITASQMHNYRSNGR